GIIGDALSRAAQAAWTRPLPKSAGARLRFLMKREKGSTRAVAARVGVSQRTVQRWIKGETHPTGKSAEALEREAARDWQPRVSAEAQRRSAQAGILVETRARFGFTAAPGTTDDGRIRRIAEVLPPDVSGEMWAAWRAGDEDRLNELVGQGLGYSYFQDRGRRAQGLDVELTDIDYIELGEL
ncbi:telomere-protecting terminal protein Tpg, partial [Streptomyces lydicus]|uniref:telomere-protecting terminal protein Tpg n=2 Tax=Streptomyces TaxID=1883 RepID=UPI0037987B05